MTDAKPRFTRKLTLSILAAIVVLTAIVSLVGWVWFGWWEIAQNRRVLNSLPVLPNAQLINIDSDGYGRADLLLAQLFPPDGWITRAQFSLNGYSRNEVKEFYISHLSPAWELCPGRDYYPWRSEFVRGDTRLALSNRTSLLESEIEMFTVSVRGSSRRDSCD